MYRSWVCSALAALSVSAILPNPAGAQTSTYPLTEAAGVVDFTIDARMLFAFKREGKFTDFRGQLAYNAAQPEDTRVDLTVFTSSVDMNDREQTNLLRSPDFFDVERFPTMHFVSSAAAVAPDGKWTLTGDLTIRGITKRITVPFRLASSAAGASSVPVLETTFQIDRTEFGLNGSPRWSGVKVSIGRKVQIHIAVAAAAGSQR